MAGERDLGVMLRDLAPTLRPDVLVVCTLEEGRYGALAEARPFASIAEDEGLTLVLTIDAAKVAELSYEGTFRAITLRVHSSLEAVGLTSAVSRALADEGIPANLLAGYFHDHVLVPSDRASDAMACLRALRDSASRG